MAMTLRLPEQLAEQGRQYAAKLGVSLNALLAIALREYLDARRSAAPMPRTPQTLAQAIVQRVKAGPVRTRRR